MDPNPLIRNAAEAFGRGELDSARALAERGLRSGPSPELHHLLGLIDCRTGNLDAGVEWLRKAHEANPASIAFRVMLARALTDCGRGEEALEIAAPPQAATPGDLPLWHARAEAAAACGQLDVAASAWAKVAEAAPRNWRGWANLGSTYSALQRWAEAADALARAAELNAADGGLRADLGKALAQAQRHAEAAAELQKARELGIATLEVEFGLGQALIVESRFDEAEQAFRRALAIDPTDRAVVLQLGSMLDRTNQVDALETLLDESAKLGLGEDQLSYLWALLARRRGDLKRARELLLRADAEENPIAWHRLRGKIADEVGDSEEAFEAAAAMNRAARLKAGRLMDLDEQQRASAAYRDELRQLARTITPEWAADIPRIDDDKPERRLSFLLGFPRSGTTLIDTLLMGHPDIEVLEEKQLVGTAGAAIGGVEKLSGASLDALRDARRIYFEQLAALTPPSFSGLVVDKFPLDMASAPLIQAMFPGAPLIFAQRHPCDVVVSAFMQSVGLVNFSDIAAAADYYDAIMSVWTASRDAMGLNVHTIVYEELVEDPERTMRPLVRFLGLDWDGRVLDHRRTAKARGTIITPSYDQVTEPITSRAVGRWKKYRKQLEPVLPVLLPWAERLGYAD
jgi:tetratricopeptide (TPR) repeat protein